MNYSTEKGPFYHGTKADLKIGDFLEAGHRSNYRPNVIMNHIYFTSIQNGAVLAAALAKGEGKERIYEVIPTGIFVDDPNVTDKKFPGNPTKSYRSKFPLKIVSEVTDFNPLSQTDRELWNERLAKANYRDEDIIN